jgi:AcrR family transcriptional regulator
MQTHPLRARIKETVSGAILDAAEQLAAEVGLPAASIQAIAQRAGVAIGTIYNYFSDRNELLVELFARRRAELLATLDAASKDCASSAFDAQLDSFVRTVFTYFDARRSFLHIAMDGTARAHAQKAGDKTQNTIEQLHARAERIIRVGLKENRLRSEGAELFSIFLVAAVRAVLNARAGSAKPLAGETEQVIDLFLRGAGP